MRAKFYELMAGDLFYPLFYQSAFYHEMLFFIVKIIKGVSNTCGKQNLQKKDLRLTMSY
jgi:hypothetical protein